jgi:hypothetical protein
MIFFGTVSLEFGEDITSQVEKWGKRYSLIIFLLLLLPSRILIAEQIVPRSHALICRERGDLFVAELSHRGEHISFSMRLSDEDGDRYFNGNQRRGMQKSSPVAVVQSAESTLVSFFSRKGKLLTAEIDFPDSSNQPNTACRTGRVLVIWKERGQGTCAVRSSRVAVSPAKAFRASRVSRPNLSLALEADAEFVAAFSGKKRALRAMKAAAHAANVLYMDQVGVVLRIRDHHSFSDSNTQPLRSSDAQELVEQFRSYTLRNRQIRGDAKILFSGKDLSLSGDRGVAGLAYTGVVCSRPRYSFAVIERANRALETVLLAHELGHLLGAQHTADTNTIMSPIARGSHGRFAPESLQEIATQVSNYPACL